MTVLHAAEIARANRLSLSDARYLLVVETGEAFSEGSGTGSWWIGWSLKWPGSKCQARGSRSEDTGGFGERAVPNSTLCVGCALRVDGASGRACVRVC